MLNEPDDGGKNRQKHRKIVVIFVKSTKSATHFLNLSLAFLSVNQLLSYEIAELQIFRAKILDRAKVRDARHRGVPCHEMYSY